MIFLLIKNGVVVNSVVADQTFADSIKSQYDFVIQTANKPGDPSVGYLYNGSTFSAPPVVITDDQRIGQKGADIEFGRKIFIEFTVANDKRNLSSDQIATITKLFSEIQGYLLAGQLDAVLKYLPLITVDGVLFTNQIIADLTQKITTYKSGVIIK